MFYYNYIFNFDKHFLSLQFSFTEPLLIVWYYVFSIKTKLHLLHRHRQNYIDRIITRPRSHTKLKWIIKGIVHSETHSVIYSPSWELQTCNLWKPCDVCGKQTFFFFFPPRKKQSYRFRTTWGWVNNVKMFTFSWTFIHMKFKKTSAFIKCVATQFNIQTTL